MKKNKYVIAAFMLSILSLLLIFSQLNNTKTSAQQKLNFEDLGEHVKNYKTTASLIDSIIDEQRYAEQYFFKKHLTAIEMTDDEAKEQAFNQVLEETALLEKAKSENLLATKAEAKKMSDEARDIMKNEPKAHEEVIRNVNAVIKGLGITDDEYFNEILVDAYIVSISIENLYNKVTDSYDQEVKRDIWEEFKLAEIAKFVDKNKENINEFIKINNIK